MYKVGETVICIDDHNGAGDIELNKIYIVKAHEKHFLQLEGIPSAWIASRFKPYNYRKEKLKKILCLK